MGIFLGIIIFAIMGYFVATLWSTGSFTGRCVSNPAFDLSGLCKGIKMAGIIIGSIIGFFVGRFIPL